MTQSDIFKQTKGAYWGLMRPARDGGELSKHIDSLIAIAPAVPADVVTFMLAGASWRERLLGLCIAMTQSRQPAQYVDSMIQSLRDPRCLSTVPTCAALALLARRGVFAMTESFADGIDRTPFCGEVGWGIDKALHFARVRSEDAAGESGPNDGQDFEQHVQFYDSLHAGS
jgi:hypothetical protein